MNESTSSDNYHAAQMMTNEILIFKSSAASENLTDGWNSQA